MDLLLVGIYDGKGCNMSSRNRQEYIGFGERRGGMAANKGIVKPLLTAENEEDQKAETPSAGRPSCLATKTGAASVA